jgi:3-methylcrotonyl-CoA carboxylase alpha subunit
MRLRCGDEVHDVQVRKETGDTLDARVAGRDVRFALEPAGPGVFVVRIRARAVLLHLVRDGRTVHLSWDGVVYVLEEEREGVRAAARHDPGALEAPMPGRVAAVRVALGQRVAKGEELLVVEAMKMENALRAPRDGVVRAVHVAAGDMVAPGRTLVEVD